MKVNFEELQQTPDNRISENAWMIIQNAQQSSRKRLRIFDSEKPKNLSINISYPYSLNRSLSPENYRRQMQSIREQLPMEESTFRFIKSSIEQQMAKRQKQIHRQNKSKLVDYTHKKIRGQQLNLQNEMNSKEKRNDDPIKVEDLIDSLNGSISQIKMGNSIQKSLITVPKKKNKPLKVLNEEKTTVKRRRQSDKYIPTKQRHKMQEQAQITYHPQLIQNKYNKKFSNRNSKGAVYSKLHQDHIILTYKRSLEKHQQQQSINQMHNCRNKYANNKVTRKMLKNYIPFYERYDQQMQKNAEKIQKSLHNHQYDWKTGQKMYTPNLNLSKQTYKKFQSSLSLEKKASTPSKQKKDNTELQSQTSKNHLTTQLKTKKAQMSITNIPSTSKESLSISSLNKSVQLNDNFKNLIMNRIANIFFSQNNNYRKGVSQLSQLNHSEFQVLYPFLTSLQSFGSVNRPLFIDLLKKFYQKLTLYDRGILRQENERLKKANLKRTQRIQEATKQITHHPTINQRSLNLSREKDKHHEALFFH